MTIDKFSSENYSRFCKLYGSQPVRLRRAKKPLRRASKPLRRASKPLRRANKPLRRAIISLRRSNQSLRKSSQSLRRSSQSLRRSKQSLRRSNKSLRRSNQSLRRSNQSLWRSNQSLDRTQNNPLEKNGYQPSTKPAVSHNQSINYKMSHYKRARHSIGTCINSNDGAHQCRLSARQLTKQPHVKRIRDREPSRLPLRRIVLGLRKRKNRSFLKHYFLNSAPKSSFLYMVASDYKLCCFQFVHMQHIFINSFAYFKPSVNCSSKSQLKSGNYQYKYTNQQYHISQKKLMLSGDIELNPGPSYDVLLEQRLRHFQLRPFDAGGDGDCFFRAVSHQLYGDPEHHLRVRAAGIAYMRDNPERFIESNTEISWLEYLNNMSMQGTWGDAIIIQAVADQLKIKIVIAETHEHFTEYSIVQAVSSTQQLTEVYLGHIDEYHYVSTLPCLAMSDLNQNHLNFSENVGRNQTTEISFNQNVSTSTGKQATLSCQSKQQKKQYMNEYMRQKQAGQSIQAQINTLVFKEKRKQYMKEYRERKRASESFQQPIQSAEFKQKKKQYMKEYRKRKRAGESFQQPVQSAESKQKQTQYMKEYRERKRANESFQQPIQSPESKQKKTQYMKEYREQKRFQCEPLHKLIAKFHDVVSQGPLYICTCCDQLWYKHSVIPAAVLKKNNPSIQNKLLNKTSVNNVEWLCQTCNKHLKNNKVPPCAAINGMKFPVKPSFFDLNELECRLLAPRIAFQKLMQAPRGKQLKINGNIVNVPADVANTVSMLPRLPSETSTIKVNFKRRLQYKSSALSLKTLSGPRSDIFDFEVVDLNLIFAGCI